MIRVIWPGKTKKSYYRLAIEDYAWRLKKLIPFELIETREASTTDKKQRLKRESRELIQKKKAPVVVTLDAGGVMMTSGEFANWLRQKTGDIDFLIGGPEGFEIPGETLRWSLGKITLPHELARVVALEQIYRAITILKNIPYHK
jgi:23S rRNA (pseudouridine1915-N3)-methyltransferase